MLALTDWIVAASALFSAVFAGVLALLTCRLIVVGRDQHRSLMQSNVSARRAASAAKDAATAAADANRLNREALIADQRPWVTVAAIAPATISFGTEGCAIPLTITLANIGKSPAQSVVIYPHLTITGGQFDATKELQKLREESPRTDSLVENTCIFPGDTIEVEHIMCISPQKLAELSLSRGVRHFVPGAYGYITYSTDFDDRIRQTGFVFQIKWPAGMSIQLRDGAIHEPIHGEFAPWPRGWFAT